MIEMVAFSVGLGLSSGDFVSVSKAVRWAQQDLDLTFIAVLDEGFFEIAVTNPNNIKIEYYDVIKHGGIVEIENMLFNSAAMEQDGVFQGTLILGFSLQSIEKKIANARITAFIVGLSVLLMFLFAFWVIRRTVIRPILGLRKAAEDVSKGQTDVEVEVLANDEVGQLSNTFNSMVVNVRKAREELETLESIVKVINREVALEKVLNALLEQGLRLFLQAEKGAILLRDQRDSMFRFAAWAGYETDVLKDIVICQEEATNRYADAPDEVDKGVYLPRNLKALVDDDRLADLAIPKSLLTMTVELDGVLEGFLMFLNMTDSEAFNRSDSRKLNRFREHAISAIAKAKTLQILQEKNEELVRTQKQLVVQEKLASLGELTAGIAHEIKNPLNFVNNFAELSVGLVDELKQEIKKNKEHLDSETAEHVDEILTDLAYNAGEIQQSGSRADSIIQGMLLHSRGGTGERRDTDINVLLNQYLALAYHSMRAQDSAFEATMENDYDESIGKISVVPQDLGRVFLNILNNACHAILEMTKKLQDGYSPTLSVSTKSLGDKVEIRIRDNGSGIAEEIKDKIFNPFFTTKPPGEGTGLGLSLSYDIIVKEHRGDIKVESERDSFTEFIITLPKE